MLKQICNSMFIDFDFKEFIISLVRILKSMLLRSIYNQDYTACNVITGTQAVSMFKQNLFLDV